MRVARWTLLVILCCAVAGCDASPEQISQPRRQRDVHLEVNRRNPCRPPFVVIDSKPSVLNAD